MFVTRLVKPALSAALLAAGSASARPQAAPAAAPPAPTTPAERAAIAGALAPALVRVAIHLQYDAGEAPADERGRESYESLIREERPSEGGGILVAPQLVMIGDPMIDDRFIRRITVSFGGAAVEASPSTFADTRDAILLELEKPLPGAVPLSFDTGAPAPHFMVTWGPYDATWRTVVEPLTSTVWALADGRRVIPARPGAVVVDRRGTPVGVTDFGLLPVDGSWKGSPLDWPASTAAELAAIEQRIGAVADACLPRVQLRFRSPRGGPAAPGRWAYDDPEESETEWHGLGLLAGERQVLVLASLKPRKTARLERIDVHAPGGRSVTATFDGSLADFGCFLARLDAPLPGAAALLDAPIESVRGQRLVQAEIKVHGESRSARYRRQRIWGFELGWEGQVYPEAPAVTEGSDSTMTVAQNFLFDETGRLVALPVERRQKVSVEQAWGDELLMTPAAHLAAILRDPAPRLDPENRPLGENQENRIAWLGVELQALDPDLARAKNVSALSGGGATGAIVTYVYGGSPAEQGGVQAGDVLLRLHIEGHPRPLEIELEDSWAGMEGSFPWEFLDRVPEEYLDQIPTPWESAESALALALTQVGFGTPFTAEIFRDGGTIQVPLAVTEGPGHYEAAERFESGDLGLTVRDLTYEVRRYFQMAADDPGVIISRIEPGGPAAIAGLRPYEIITRVDNQPAPGIGAFSGAIAPAGEHRLVVKRMTEGRIVTIRSGGGAAAEEVGPDEPAGR